MTRFARSLACVGILLLAILVWTCHADHTVSPPGPATQLSFSTQPTNGTAGATISVVKVTALDANGSVATAYNGTVTLSISNGTPGATLSGTTTVNATSAVATFTVLRIDKSGSGYTLSATAPGLSSAVSSGFAVAPGAASQLVFVAQPSGTSAGAIIAPAVKVAAQDALGNVVPTFAATVTLSITTGTGAAGATLLGTSMATPTSGVASYSDLQINKVGTASGGTGYTLSATATGLTAATSDPFDITSGLATHLQFSSQPTNTAAGAGFAPLIEVSVLDAVGNVVTGFSGNIMLAIGTNVGGATLHGANSVAVVMGVATFPGVYLDKVGTGYTLTAGGTGVTLATSAAFNVTAGPAATLTFTTQPVTTTDAAPIAPAVQVSVRDAFGNAAVQFAGNVTVVIGANPGSGFLSGTTTLAATAGVATFADLNINKVGTGYTLVASATGVTPVTSSTFDIVPSTAARLVCTVQPTTTIAGATITPAVQVAARDASNQLVTGFTGNVALALTGGAAGATLSGTASVAAVAGVATFNNLNVDKSGSGYGLTATSAGLVSATCGPFDITSATAATLAFTVNPSNVAAGGPIAPQVEVTAHDAHGNVATGFTGMVTMAINPSSGGLTGTTSVAAVAGVASFANLHVTNVGVGYTLSASATGPSSATSGAFDVTAGAPSQLVFTVPPSNATAGATITPAVQVTAKDAMGNVVTSFVDTVALTITAGSGTAGASLSGTRKVKATLGVASFADLSIDKVGPGYTLSATAIGVAGTTSGAFNITAGAATALVFTAQPATLPAGTTFAVVQVTATDAHGNTVPSFIDNVSVAIGTNPSGGSLSGTTTVAAVGGVASFSTLSIDKVGAGYTLTALSGALTGATSVPFDITAGTALTLTFSVQPSNVAAGSAIAPAVRVTARDAQGNPATAFTGDVTIAIATNPAGGTLGGTATVAAVAGVATFSNLFIDKAGTGYTLSANATGLTGVTSATFNVAPGAATTLVFTGQPTTATTNANITPAVKVTARDALGNTATGFNGNITVAIGANPGGGTLSGTRTFAALNGTASYQALGINNTGTGYTLTAAASGLTGATSVPFNIVTSTAVRLFFSVQPGSATAGSPIPGSTGPIIQVTARDMSGQTVASFTDNITLAITTNPGGGALGGTKTVAAVSGVASFPNVNIDKTGTGYKLTASASGLTDAVSAAISITAGPAATLLFTLPPSTATAHATITPRVEVTAQDALGNIADGFSGDVTVAIGTNPGTGTLSGTTSTAAIRGVASFSTLSIDQAGNGYTLTASATGVTGSTSPTFDVGATLATQLVFTVQPSTATAGSFINPALEVSARDASGMVATGFTGSVTLTITANTGTSGSTLSGTTTAPIVSGVATFSNLSINHSGSGFRLSATAPGASGTTSTPFTINFGTPARVAFSVQPATTNAATIIGGFGGPTIQATVEDGLGNPVRTFAGTIAIAIATNPGGGGLSGTTSVPAVNGVASFNDLMIDKSGTGYRLGATATALVPDTSDAFSITAGPATTFLFTVQPSNAAAGVAISPAMRVTAFDAQGNQATGFTGDVTLDILNNPSGGTLSGVPTVTPVNGVAVFSGMSISPAGIGYTLKATAAGVTQATSVAFNIN